MLKLLFFGQFTAIIKIFDEWAERFDECEFPWNGDMTEKLDIRFRFLPKPEVRRINNCDQTCLFFQYLTLNFHLANLNHSEIALHHVNYFSWLDESVQMTSSVAKLRSVVNVATDAT